MEESVKQQALLIAKFIKIAASCLLQLNYNTLMEILTGLNHSCISRLKNAWALVPDKYIKTLKKLGDTMSPQSNFSHYRQVGQHIPRRAFIFIYFYLFSAFRHSR